MTPIELTPLAKTDSKSLNANEDFLLTQHENLRQKLIAARANFTREADNNRYMTYNLDSESIPDNILPEASFNHLANNIFTIKQILSEPPSEAPTPYEAKLWMVQRHVLLLVLNFSELTLYRVAFDKEYALGHYFNVNVSDLFGPKNLSSTHFDLIQGVEVFTCLKINTGSEADIRRDCADVNQLLQMSSRIFFDTTMASYRLPEVIACSMAFNAILMKFQKEPIEAELAIYRQRWDEMYAAICRFEARDKIFDIDADWKEHISEGIKEIGAKVDILLKRSEASAPKKTTRKRYLCSNKLAAKYFGVSETTIERWRAYYRDPNDPNAVRPPQVFPQGYDVTPKAMEYAGKKYRGLID